MIDINVLILLFFLLLLFLFIILLRYNKLRFIILYLKCVLNGNHMIVTKDLSEAKQYLHSDIKGQYIEHHIARYAWKPILSIESEDGDTYFKLKKQFMYIVSTLDVKEFEVICKNKIKKYFDEYSLIDSQCISYMACDCLLTWVFGEYWNDNTDWSIYLFYNASIEWRKQLAMKGFGNNNIKNGAVNEIKRIIQNSKWKDESENIYFYSIILQSFVISPMINVADIMACFDFDKDINDNIELNHPFPMLERFIHPNTQVFIPTDTLKILAFGYGVRKCPGRMYATILLNEIKSNAINMNYKWHPTLKHKYSGRNNDYDISINAFLYTIHVLCKFMFNK